MWRFIPLACCSFIAVGFFILIGNKDNPPGAWDVSSMEEGDETIGTWAVVYSYLRAEISGNIENVNGIDEKLVFAK
jgi:hypothetical protein